MSSIQQILASILNAVYGKDVRQAIHDGVEMAYDKADDAATSAAAAAEAASGSQESAASSAQAAADSASSASDFADAAEQYKNEAFHTTPAGYEDFVNQVNSSLGYLANSGVKNVLNLTLDSIVNANIGHASFSGNVCSINGIDFTVSQSSDGGIEIDVNGVATGNAHLYLIPTLSNNIFKNMILNGSPATSDCSLLVSYFQNGTWKGEQFSYNMMDSVMSSDYPQILICIFVASGKSINHLKFHPMIRDASISDSSYQPYAQSNVVLTETFKLIKRGRKQFSTTIGSSGTVSITFDKPFQYAPTLLYSLRGNADIPNVIHTSIDEVTEQGFTISWKNTGSSGQAYSPFIEWCAIEISDMQTT